MEIYQVTYGVDFPVVFDLAYLMRMLKEETEPGKAVKEIDQYVEYIEFKLNLGSIIYYIPTIGFMMMDKATDMLLQEPHKHYWMMSHVFIKPEFRKGRAYPMLLNNMLANTEGQIIGLTYKNSDHNKVMQKRYKVLGTIYGRYE